MWWRRANWDAIGLTAVKWMVTGAAASLVALGLWASVNLTDYSRLMIELQDPVLHEGPTVAGYSPRMVDEPRPTHRLQWYPGQTAALWRHFCILRAPIHVEVTREFRDTLVYKVHGSDSPIYSTFPPGCYAVSVPLPIPADLPPRQYQYVATVRERANPLKTNDYDLRQVSLDIWPAAPPPHELSRRIEMLERQIKKIGPSLPVPVGAAKDLQRGCCK